MADAHGFHVQLLNYGTDTYKIKTSQKQTRQKHSTYGITGNLEFLKGVVLFRNLRFSLTQSTPSQNLRQIAKR